MGWFDKFKQDLSTNVKKEWGMSDTSNQTASSAVTTVGVDQNVKANPKASGVFDISATVASANTAASDGIILNPSPVDVAGTTIVATPTKSPNIAVRTMTAVASDFETAINDVESFISSKEKYIEGHIAAELVVLKAAALADYNKVLAEKQALVTALENEFTAARTWLSNKWAQIKAVF